MSKQTKVSKILNKWGIKPSSTITDWTDFNSSFPKEFGDDYEVIKKQLEEIWQKAEKNKIPAPYKQPPPHFPYYPPNSFPNTITDDKVHPAPFPIDLPLEKILENKDVQFDMTVAFETEDDVLYIIGVLIFRSKDNEVIKTIVLPKKKVEEEGANAILQLMIEISVKIKDILKR